MKLLKTKKLPWWTPFITVMVLVILSLPSTPRNRIPLRGDLAIEGLEDSLSKASQLAETFFENTDKSLCSTADLHIHKSDGTSDSVMFCSLSSNSTVLSFGIGELETKLSQQGHKVWVFDRNGELARFPQDKLLNDGIHAINDYGDKVINSDGSFKIDIINALHAKSIRSIDLLIGYSDDKHSWSILDSIFNRKRDEDLHFAFSVRQIIVKFQFDSFSSCRLSDIRCRLDVVLGKFKSLLEIRNLGFKLLYHFSKKIVTEAQQQANFYYGQVENTEHIVTFINDKN
eukprot:TRINITY_DN581_c0_g1_i1.p1 TRINITY_DN581_c0_g1~~TRINITY_DN581_c0_g1_i1.p1  ORF type:complete len:286 (-),score=30.45 TRINITY_DN581_c0_g1_i1:16-873(-)